MPTIDLRLTPNNTAAVSKAPIFYSTQGSTSSDDEEITYEWSISTPINSSDIATELLDDGESFILYPDVNGGYIVTVTATTDTGGSATKKSKLLVVSNPSSLLRTRKRSNLIGDSVGDFWKYIDNKEVFQAVWDEYLTCVSNDYRYLSDAFLSSSIENIQEAKAVTNVILPTTYVIPEGSSFVKSSRSFYGNNAATEDSVVTGTDSITVGLTNTVYIPADSIGGANLFSKKSINTTVTIHKNGSVTLDSPVVWFSSATLKVLSGKASGFSTTLVSTASGYKLSSIPFEAFRGSESSVIVRVRIEKESFYKDILLTVDSNSALIMAVDYIKSGSTTYAKILLDKKVPANKTNLAWRLCSTLTHSTALFEYNGVSVGDGLSFLMHSSYDSAATTVVQAVVAGVYKNRISFEITDEDLTDINGNETGSIVSNKTFYTWFTDLKIPGATQNVDGTYVFSSVASLGKSSFTTAKDLHAYNKIQSSPRVSLDFDRFNTLFATQYSYNNAHFRLSFLPTSIQRKELIDLNTTDRVISCDLVSEYIFSKESSSTADGKVAVLCEDGSVLYRESREKVLYENVHYHMINRGSFSGSFNKSKGTLVVTDVNGYFTTKGTKPGYEFQYDGNVYTVSQVNSETELEICETLKAKTLKSIKLSDEYYKIARPSTKNSAFLRILPSVFSLSTLPPSLYAPSVVVSNDSRIEDNFGALTGYTLEKYTDFSEPSISYLTATKALMRCRITGVTSLSAELVAAVLTNTAMTETPCEIVSVNTTEGKIVVEEIDEVNLLKTGILRSYAIGTEYSAEPFSTIAVNPFTQETIKEGDLLPRFTLLSGKAVAEDTYTAPELFDYLGVQRYHTWQILLAAESVKSRDIKFLVEFFQSTAPAHITVKTTYVATLVTQVSISNSITFDGTLKFIDSSALSNEASANVDNRNNSDQILSAFGVSDLSTRTLSLGRDLIATATGRVSSERGGFSNTITELTHYSPFDGVMPVQGTSLVKSGDILRIYSGPNIGVYLITSVVSDTELDVTALSGRLPYTSNLTESSVKSNFAVFRAYVDSIIEGISPTSVDSTESTFANIDFLVDGFAVGDVVVNENDYTDRFVVVAVNNATIVTDTALDVNNTYLVYRESLLSSKYAQDKSFVYSSSYPTYVTHSIENGFLIERGDTLTVTSGSTLTQEAKVVYVGHDFFLIDQDILTNGCSITLSKYWLPLNDSVDDSLEKLHGLDRVTATLESTSAISTVSAKQTGPNGLEYLTVSGISNAAPGDYIYLYDGTNLMLESIVWKLDGANNPVVIVIQEDASLAVSTNYNITIEKTS